jgi:dipeptidyl aminopeptidase/acylaminoacyl peptidase
LNLLIDEGHNFLNYQVAETQIGSDEAKLKLNSPLQHAAEFNAPLPMLHGDMDAQVPFEQSSASPTATISSAV